MVRINTIHPKLLTDEHLYAENVESQMILSFINKYPKGFIPDSYRLGEGHISYFRDKKNIILNRKEVIQQEMDRRKTNNSIQYITLIWTPSKKDKQINIQRIIDRLRNPIKKKTPWHYCGKVIIDIESFINEMYREI